MKKEEKLYVEYDSYMLPNLYSLRLSLFYPDWSNAFHSKEKQEFINQHLLLPEAPMNIAIDSYYLSLEEMREFEAAYRDWLIGRINKTNPSGATLMALILKYRMKKEANLKPPFELKD